MAFIHAWKAGVFQGWLADQRLPWPDRPIRSCSWAGLFAGRRQRQAVTLVLATINDREFACLPAVTDRTLRVAALSVVEAFLRAATGRIPVCHCTQGRQWHPSSGDRSDTCVSQQSRFVRGIPCSGDRSETACRRNSRSSEAFLAAATGRIPARCNQTRQRHPLSGDRSDNLPLPSMLP